MSDENDATSGDFETKLGEFTQTNDDCEIAQCETELLMNMLAADSDLVSATMIEYTTTNGETKDMSAASESDACTDETAGDVQDGSDASGGGSLKEAVARVRLA
ncbi:uncharacterized protein IUM83_10979 [Phytophthora cinnamomi]|uniref:uncharacterized protein n=1 Tax=Phytophthora cinnamomi TaxID=4785 RepID=UPI003559727F|nr:hypothetical protein IUM83_10979 [Phytophthora cinnamomi]